MAIGVSEKEDAPASSVLCSFPTEYLATLRVNSPGIFGE
jgi:hypothetical protein